SSLVRSVFLHAAEKGVKFGLSLLTPVLSLRKGNGSALGLRKHQMHLCPHIRRSIHHEEVSKVIVGASSILANGTV
ncbi:Uncharacterized protein FKW44_000054, partial [Caligus rogercresseyi]